jgi:hypothetical protein
MADVLFVICACLRIAVSNTSWLHQEHGVCLIRDRNYLSSRASAFTPSFCWGYCCLSFLVFCVVFYFFVWQVRLVCPMFLLGKFVLCALCFLFGKFVLCALCFVLFGKFVLCALCFLFGKFVLCALCFLLDKFVLCPMLFAW